MKKILLTLFILAFYTGSFAALYYVDPSSNGTNSGTLANPWKTLSAINWTTIQPGDFIYFKRGQKIQGQLTIGKSGTAAARITLGAYGTGENPLFWGTGSSITQLFNMNGRNYITFQDLTISDTTISISDRTVQSKIERVWSNGGAYNEIRRCKIDRVGVGAYWTGSNNLIDSCDIGNMRMIRNTIGGDDDYGANPLVISSANNRVTNNYFHDCWATSYDYQIDGGAVEFYGNGASNNFIGYNTFYDCNGVAENGSDEAGVIENNIFAYNILIDNGSVIYIHNRVGSNFYVEARNVQFYNNVIVESKAWRLPSTTPAIIKFATTPTIPGQVIFKNNIVWLYGTIDVGRNGQCNTSSFVHTNNLYRLGSGSVLDFTLHSTEQTTSNPGWVSFNSGNPIASNFNITAESPAFEFGTPISGLTRDLAGRLVVNKPEAGVYEFGVTVTPPPPVPVRKSYIIKAGQVYINSIN